MADFADIGEIASRCMGYEDNRFLNAYYKNIDLQAEESIEANPVGNAIVKLMEERNEQEPWDGTASELLTELVRIAEQQLKINTNSKLWPKAPNSLSRKITEVMTNLRQIGIVIDRYVKDPKRNVKALEIRKISPVSQDRKIEENQAQVASDISGDTSNPTGDISQEPQISPDKNPENHAQYGSYGDTGDTCDILDTSKGPDTNNNTVTINELEPILSVEEFFYNNPDPPDQPLSYHVLEQSPCYPIIGVNNDYKISLYYCKLHPDVENANLETIEHHCKYKDPDKHKAEILQRLLKEKEKEKVASITNNNNILYSQIILRNCLINQQQTMIR